jgi:hypothetical protein
MEAVTQAVRVVVESPPLRFIFACHLQGCLNNSPALKELAYSGRGGGLDDAKVRMGVHMCADSDSVEPAWALRADLDLQHPRTMLGQEWDDLPTCADVVAATYLTWDCIRRHESVEQVLQGELRPFYVKCMPEWFQK